MIHLSGEPLLTHAGACGFLTSRHGLGVVTPHPRLACLMMLDI
jgi:hypothetical protein